MALVAVREGAAMAAKPLGSLLSWALIDALEELYPDTTGKRGSVKEERPDDVEQRMIDHLKGSLLSYEEGTSHGVRRR
jgi:hypothetical protein